MLVWFISSICDFLVFILLVFANILNYSTMSAKERLKEFLSYKKIGRNRFEDQIGVSTGYVSSKSMTITSDVIEKTKRMFPDLNLDWLIIGEGEMTTPVGVHVGNIKNSTAVVNYGDGNEIANNRTSPTEELLQLQREYLDMLKKKDEQIDRLTGVIEKLMGKL